MLVDRKRTEDINVKDGNYFSNWDEEGTDVETVAGFIRKKSEYGDIEARNGDYI